MAIFSARNSDTLAGDAAMTDYRQSGSGFLVNGSTATITSPPITGLASDGFVVSWTDFSRDRQKADLAGYNSDCTGGSIREFLHHSRH